MWDEYYRPAPKDDYPTFSQFLAEQKTCPAGHRFDTRGRHSECKRCTVKGCVSPKSRRRRKK